jgi:hypothetical protein
VNHKINSLPAGTQVCGIMKIRFMLGGIVLAAIGAILFQYRDHRLNFLIPVVVGLFIFFYGMVSK